MTEAQIFNEDISLILTVFGIGSLVFFILAHFSPSIDRFDGNIYLYYYWGNTRKTVKLW